MQNGVRSWWRVATTLEWQGRGSTVALSKIMATVLTGFLVGPSQLELEIGLCNSLAVALQEIMQVEAIQVSSLQMEASLWTNVPFTVTLDRCYSSTLLDQLGLLPLPTRALRTIAERT